MPKFNADRIYRMTDESGNIIVSLVVTGYNRRVAEMVVGELKGVENIGVEVKESKSKRSLEQNSMLWSLLTKIALETSGTKDKTTIEQLYCDFLEETNAKFDYIVAPLGSEKRLSTAYRVVREKGKRRIIREDGKETEGALYQCFIGSSHYDTKEMTELIETVMRRCDELGISDSELETIRGEYH